MNFCNIAGMETDGTTARRVRSRLAAAGIALAIVTMTGSVVSSAYACAASTAPVSSAPVDQCEQFGCVD